MMVTVECLPLILFVQDIELIVTQESEQEIRQLNKYTTNLQEPSNVKVPMVNA